MSGGVKRQMLEWWGPIIHEYYAGTEDIGSTWITAQEWMAHPGSVGRPCRAPAHIVGPDGDGAGAAGEEGIVYFEGGRPFEYHNNPGRRRLDDRTEEAGGRSVTSGASMRTDTCISPTGRPT